MNPDATALVPSSLASSLESESMSDPDIVAERAAGRTALLIVDMINDLCFASGEVLLGEMETIADPLLALRAAATAQQVPVVYVNDNFGHWQSERSKLIDHCAREGAPGRGMVERMRPRDDDYFVIKPQFSGFYSTNLPVLLPKLGVTRLILTGVAADICVMFTAADAHMRNYELWVPSDCVAASDPQRADWALTIMENSMGAEIRPTTELAIEAWLAKSD